MDPNTVRVKLSRWRMFLFVDLISAYFTSGARRGGKHALQHAQMTTMSPVKFFNFPNELTDVNGLKKELRCARFSVPVRENWGVTRKVSENCSQQEHPHGRETPENVNSRPSQRG